MVTKLQNTSVVCLNCIVTGIVHLFCGDAYTYKKVVAIYQGHFQKLQYKTGEITYLREF